MNKKYDWFNIDEVKMTIPDIGKYFIEFRSRSKLNDPDPKWTHLHNYYSVEDAANDIPRLEMQNPNFIYRVSKK